MIVISENKKYRDRCKESRFIKVILQKADLQIGWSHQLISTSYYYHYNLLIGKENIVDYIVNVDLIADGGGNSVEIVDKLFKVLPRLALGEDRM